MKGQRHHRFWTLSFRVQQCLRFRDALHHQRLQLKRIKTLEPGKQGSVHLEEDQKTGIKVVVKRSDITGSVAKEKSLHRKRKVKGEFHPWGTQPLIERRVGQLVSSIMEKHYCPNLVFQYEMDIGLSKGQLASIMEAFDGDLTDLLRKQHGTLSDNLWYSLWFQMCAGLIALHRNGVTHTDMHTSNVLYKKIPHSTPSYWKYKVGTRTYYVPNMGYIFAIADYGRARSPRLNTQYQSQGVVQRLKEHRIGWASYDYYRLHSRQLGGYLPARLHAEFNHCPRLGSYPLEKALHTIFTPIFGQKSKVQGICLESYDIARKVPIKHLLRGTIWVPSI